MTKNRILNVTSRKKRNGMLAWSNTNNLGQAVGGIALRNATLAGGTSHSFLWCATAQDLVPGTSGPPAPPAYDATRTSTTCFMRGLSENIHYFPNNGTCWMHRRICFTYKGDDFLLPYGSDAPIVPIIPFLDTSNGVQRLWLDETINSAPATQITRAGIIFKGNQGIDWNDFITAPVDTSRITVKFDKVWKIASGNQYSTQVRRKLWHPMNSNLRYGDDESGATEETGTFSVRSKLGMGDYYIYDLFTPGSGSTTNDLLNVGSNATLYWHEK